MIMGVCGSTPVGSSEERARARRLNAELAMETRRDKAQVKMLLLGAGSSGKTTIFKQMRILYGEGFDEEGRKAFCSVIRRSVVENMQLLVAALEDLGTELFTEDSEEAGKVVLEFDAHAAFKLVVTKDGKVRAACNFSDEMKNHLMCLWQDPGVVEGYANRGALQLNDNFAFNMDNIERICSEAWIPSVEDVLNARVR